MRGMNALIDRLANVTEVDTSKFMAVGFPCTQFARQEPGQNGELINGYTYIRPGDGIPPKFPIVEKLEVNGDGEHALYTFIKAVCPGTQPTIGTANGCLAATQGATRIPSICEGTRHIGWSPVKQADITWNYEKILIDKNGLPFRRYSPRDSPELLFDDIITLLSAKEEKQPKTDSIVKSTLHRMMMKP
jgi:glutathione peroxidase